MQPKNATTTPTTEVLSILPVDFHYFAILREGQQDNELELSCETLEPSKVW